MIALTPWRRGPRRLLRHPAAAIALVVAALVATLPAAAAPLFLSSAEHATLHRQIAEACPDTVGVQVSGSVGRAGPAGRDEVVGTDRATARVEVLAAALPATLAAPRSTLQGEFDLARAVGDPLPDGQTGVTILGRADAGDHVSVVAGPVGTGLWLPDRYATTHGLRPGDELEVTARGEPTAWDATDAPPEPVAVPVAAVYRDLRDAPDREAWCGAVEAYRGPPGAEDDPGATILPMALLDPPALLEVGAATRARVTQVVAAPLRERRPTVPAAATTAARIAQVRDDTVAQAPQLFPSAFQDGTGWSSSLGRSVDRAGLVRQGLLPPVLPITAAGTVAGLAMVTAAAVYWCRRRRRELVVLAGHGASPGQLGVKAVLEAGPALAVGSVLGWIAAWALTVAVGPSPVLAPEALPRALATSAAVGAVAVVLTATVATLSTRALTDRPPEPSRRRWWRHVPWEVGLLAAVPAAWTRLGATTTGELAAGVGTVSHVPARLLVAPLLGLLGGSLLLARLTAATLRRRGLRRTPRDPARLLAWRRVVRDAGPVAVLAATTAAPLAMAAFSATATASIRASDDATLRFALGSAGVLALERDAGALALPPEIASRTTQVLRVSRQRVAGRTVDLLGIDPDRFVPGAYWDPRLPGPSLDDVAGRVTAGGSVVTSADVPLGPTTLALRDAEVTVDVVASRTLPGGRGGRSLVLVHRDVLDQLLDGIPLGRNELWVAGDVDATIAAVSATGTGIPRQDRLEDRRVGAVHEPVSFTFQYLTALSIFTGLIGAAGLVLHLEARVSAHRRAYVLLRRLGVSAATHRRSLLLEVGGPLAAGTVLGLATAVAAATALRGGFDLAPSQPPGPILVVPAGLMVALMLVAGTVAVTTALLAQWRLGRADPAEVLRDAG